MLVKEFIADYLEMMGLTHVFGMSGANIEDLFFELSSRRKIKVILAKNEYNASMMAIGSYLASKKVTAALTTSGAGVLNAIPVLAEGFSSNMPFVLISGVVQQALEGRGGFQDTSGKEGTFDIAQMIKPVTGFCVKLDNANDIAQALVMAFEQADLNKKPSAILIPQNLLNQAVSIAPPQVRPSTAPDCALRRQQSSASFLHKLQLSHKQPLVLLGEELIHLKQLDAVYTFIEKTQAKVAVVPVAKGLFDHHSLQFIGITGMMGHDSVLEFLTHTDTLILIGTQFDFLSRFGLADLLVDQNIIIINETLRNFKEHIASEHIFEYTEEIEPFFELLNEQIAAVKICQRVVTRNIYKDPFTPDRPTFIHSVQQFEKALAQEPNSDIFVDAGNTGAFVTHYLNTFGKSFYYISLGMGGMGNSIGAALGSCFTSGRRSYVMMGDGSFLMYGLEMHTAVEHNLPVVFVIFNNNSHGMCSTREDVFMGATSGINSFKPSFFASGLQHMFPELSCFEVNSTPELQKALRYIKEVTGPCVISINLECNELPPFRVFKKEELYGITN